MTFLNVTLDGLSVIVACSETQFSPLRGYPMLVPRHTNVDEFKGDFHD